jgi:hypothetical protein
MKHKIKIEKEVDLKTLIVHAGVRYWEDAEVNGVEDEQGDLIPCRVGDTWKPIIDIESGKITNWKEGTKAKIHYKVVDCCGWELLDIDGNIVLSAEDGYVPDTLSPADSGYGDYVIMNIDEYGNIDGFNFNVDDFTNDED